jgi:hypothetical protein
MGPLTSSRMMNVYGESVDWQCQGKTKYSQKNCPYSTSTSQIPRISLGRNAGLRTEKPVTNPLSYETAANFPYLFRNYTFVASESVIDTKSLENDGVVLLGCTNSVSQN